MASRGPICRLIETGGGGLEGLFAASDRAWLYTNAKALDKRRAGICRLLETDSGRFIQASVLISLFRLLSATGAYIARPITWSEG